MRITTRQYAEGLAAALREAEASRWPLLLDRFFAILVRAKRRRDIPAILRQVERLEEGRTGAKLVEIVLDHPESARNTALEEAAKRVFDLKEADVVYRHRAGVGGGAVFRTGAETVDASLGGRLRQLRRFLEGVVS